MYWNGVVERLNLTAKGSWFIYLTGSILLYFSITTTKNISRNEWILLCGMVGFYGWLINIVIFYIFDLLDSGDSSIGGIPDYFMFIVGPVTIAILFLNRYKSPTKLIRVILFSLLSFLMEYILGKLGFLKLKGWKPIYSIPCYLLVFGVALPWTLKLIRKS
ncbi:MAG: hypothetical protein E6778_09125 [Niallia nealsonii]|nr:hypothetical protein [Niallia nealsonii]